VNGFGEAPFTSPVELISISAPLSGIEGWPSVFNLTARVFTAACVASLKYQM
jgi:hypothetical protein